MRNMRMAIPMVMAMLLAGCVPSLHPLYTEKDVVFDPALVGTWVEKGGDDRWVVSRSGNKNYYSLLNTPKGKGTGRFEAHLVQLGSSRFLDVYPEEPELRNDTYKFHLIPAHSISRIWLEGDVLRVGPLDEDWLRRMINEKKVQIAHERLNKNLVLTAPTAELQKLVVRYADDPKAFPEPAEFGREK